MALLVAFIRYRFVCNQGFFFSSSLAVNALWHGPDNDISGEKGGTQLNWPVLVKGQIITQNRKNRQNGHSTIEHGLFVAKAVEVSFQM